MISVKDYLRNNLNPELWQTLSQLKKIPAQFLQKIASFNYYTAKTFYQYKCHYRGKRFNGTPLLIYQMGKVGSQTILNSLRALKIDMPIYHVHSLLREDIQRRIERGKKYFNTEAAQYVHIESPWRSQYLREQIDRGFNGKRYKIISLVRDPIAVNIASFFERMSRVEPCDGGRSYKILSHKDEFDLTVKTDDLLPLTALFFEKIDHHSPATYFDREFKSILGFDVFAHEFPKSRGYKIYNNQHTDILLIKLEHLNGCYRQAFKEFLDIDIESLTKSNEAGNKDYASLYREFKKAVILPDSYIDEIYNTKFAMHFYDEEEIKRFKKNWHTAENVIHQK